MRQIALTGLLAAVMAMAGRARTPSRLTEPNDDLIKPSDVGFRRISLRRLLWSSRRRS